MRKSSLVNAKAHLSALVDLAEHKGARILILRHGKPAAAIVPVDVAEASFAQGSSAMRGPNLMTAKQANAFLDRLAQAGNASFDPLQDLYEGRGRLERVGR